VHLYELALDEGETSREMMARARQIGLGHLTAASEVTDTEIRALCPNRSTRRAEAVAAPSASSASSASSAPGSDPRAPAPSSDGIRSRRPPLLALVLATLVLVLAAIGAVMVLGGDDGATAAPTDTGSVSDDAAVTEVTDAPGPTGPVAGTRSETPTNIVDVAEFCAGWPPVAAYHAQYSMMLAAAPDLRTVDDWMEVTTHRDATAGIDDHLVHAFGVDGPVDEVVNVQSWIFDVAFRDDTWDLDAVRRATDAAAPPVATLQTAFTQAC